MAEPRPFFYTAFATSHIKELKDLLELETNEEAKAIADRITDCLIFCNQVELMRKRVPIAKEAKEELKQFRTAIKTIKRILRGPYGISLVPREPVASQQEGNMTWSKVQREIRYKIDLDLDNLQRMKYQAEIYLNNDDLFRLNNDLPPAEISKTQSSTLSVYLWPFLLDIWHNSKAYLSVAPNRKLIEFFDLVHRVARVDDISENTFRSALDRYRLNAKSPPAKG